MLYIKLNIQRFATTLVTHSLTEVSYSIENNSSQVRYLVQLKTSGQSHNDNNITTTYTIDGVTYTNTHKLPSNSTTTIVDRTVTITHNADGTRSTSASFSCPTGISAGTMTGSQSLTLTTIPRKSSFIATDGEIEGTSKITISRASGSFTHTLLYSFGNLSGAIASGVGDSYSWNIPYSFYGQIQNSSSGTCTITCVTYNGNTEIGRTTQNITISCNYEKCRPTITGTIEDINSTTLALTGNKNILVKGYSNAKITVTATPKNGASIVSKKAFDYYGNYYFTNDITVVNGIKQSYEELYAVDSRGFVTGPSSVSCSQFIDYIPLSCKAEFKRKSQTSNEVLLDYKGNFYDDSFGSIMNTLDLTWGYRLKGSSEWTIVGNLSPNYENNTFSGSINCGDTFDYRKSYEFVIWAKDKLVSLDIISTLPKGLGDFEIYDGALLMNGVVLFYDDEKYTKNDDGTFSVAVSEDS